MKTSILALGILSPAAFADVKLPAIFSDHLVLQREASVPVWGTAEPGEEVSVIIAGQTQTTKGDADGKWSVKLNKLAGGEGQTLTVKGKNTVVVNDVLVGEVWLGSGQSNMALTVNRALNFEQEKEAANLPQIRMFTVKSGAAKTAQTDCTGSWVVCSPEAVGAFSAALYFCGREIHKTLGAPVGLINSSVGGTPIESWISAEAQQATPELKPYLEAGSKLDQRFDPEKAKAVYEKQLEEWKEAAQKAKADGQPAPVAPRDPLALRERKGNIGGLFNGKIAPLIPFVIRGVLWYQGEANSTPGKAEYYQYQLPLLVKDWRARWGSELPFAWAQLPNFDGPGRDWPTIREAMLKTLSLPKTGMGINIDIGEAKNIHPQNKQEAGRRLAQWALGTVYGISVATSGPLPAGHEIRDHEIVLKFTHADGGLVAKDGDLRGFVVAGEDKQWKPAQARIDGEGVIVSSSDVPQPRAARYAWENNPSCNLYNAAGLPASPFRTDDWPAEAPAKVAK
jgi:sialate O-acetylesterase